MTFLAGQILRAADLNEIRGGFTLIDEQILTANQASVTFAAIPQTRKDLRLVMNLALDSGGASCRIRFNGDSAANYDWSYIGFDGATTDQANDNSDTSGRAGNLITLAAAVTVDIPDYAGSLDKACVGQSYAATDRIHSFGFRWDNTAAITSITVLVSSNNLAAGSRLALYGAG